MNIYIEFLSGIHLIEVNRHHLKRVIRLIQNALSRASIIKGYERHHIVPRSWNGDDEKENIVRLTPKEHFVIHRLMTKAFPTDRPMALAFWLLSKGRILNAREYERVRRLVSQNMSERMMGVSPWNKGKQFSDDHKEKLSIAKKGIPWSDKRREAQQGVKGVKRTFQPLSEEQRKQISIRMTGRTHTEETRKKMSEKAQQRTSSPEWRKNHSEIMKTKPSPNKGKTQSEKQKRDNGTRKKDTAWITNGEISKMVKKEDVNEYLNVGFTFGRIYRRVSI